MNRPNRPEHFSKTPTSPTSPKLSSKVNALVLSAWLLATGCVFDGKGLESRQCNSRQECTEGEACIGGFCQACNGFNATLDECTGNNFPTNNGTNNNTINNGTNNSIVNNGTIVDNNGRVTNNGESNNGNNGTNMASNNGTVPECRVGETCAIELADCELEGETECTADNVQVCEKVVGPGTCECVPGAEETCGTNEGVCEEGVMTCDETGKFSACEGEVTPSEEVCDVDAHDENCDGSANEGCECTEEQICGSDTGECATGIQPCNNGELGACEGNIGPVTEVCDGLDNDCDGEVDNGITGVGEACSKGVGACEADGITVCDPEIGVVCNAVTGVPSTEVCDGLDNDCDGDVDNDIAGVGEACSEGVGACEAEGITVCDPEIGVVCNAVTGVPSDEVCDDNIDNDCDGEVNEECSPPDTDNDGVIDANDNCPNVFNSFQLACSGAPVECNASGGCVAENANITQITIYEDSDMNGLPDDTILITAMADACSKFSVRYRYTENDSFEGGSGSISVHTSESFCGSIPASPTSYIELQLCTINNNNNEVDCQTLVGTRN